MSSSKDRAHWLFLARAFAEEAEFATGVTSGSDGLTFVAEGSGDLTNDVLASVQVTVEWDELDRLEQADQLLRIAVDTVNNELRDMVATRH